MLAKPASRHAGVVLRFTVMTIVWGIVGMLVGLLIAAKLAWPGRSLILTCPG